MELRILKISKSGKEVAITPSLIIRKMLYEQTTDLSQLPKAHSCGTYI
jgi:hypothetical protein